MGLNLIKFFLGFTGAVALFLIIGFAGGLEGNLITLEQYYLYCALLLVYIAVARIIYVIANKNAPWCGNTKRAENKIINGCIIQQIGEKSNG